jgi:hypothetical protein
MHDHTRSDEELTIGQEGCTLRFWKEPGMIDGEFHTRGNPVFPLTRFAPGALRTCEELLLGLIVIGSGLHNSLQSVSRRDGCSHGAPCMLAAERMELHARKLVKAQQLALSVCDGVLLASQPSSLFPPSLSPFLAQQSVIDNLPLLRYLHRVSSHQQQAAFQNTPRVGSLPLVRVGT